MLRPIFILLTAATLVAAYLIPVKAAQGPATGQISASSAELLVFETKQCLYCFIFRRDVVPDYMQSMRAKTVPMRFIDIHETDVNRLRLSRPLTMLPTVVLMKNGREVDRINGYMGPEPFFHMVSRMLH